MTIIRRRIALAVILTLTLTSARGQTMPRSLMVVPGDGQVTLTWDTVANVAGYNVKRASTAAGSLVIIATNVQKTSLVVTNLKNGIANFYTVTSFADGFESAETPRIKVTPSAAVLDLLPAGAKLEKLATGFQAAEGPVWIPEEPGFLIFSDMHDPPFSSSSAMYKWTSASGTTLFRSATNVANGNTLDREGRLITCEGKSGRLVLTEGDGSTSPLVSLYNGKQFNSPNDLVVKSDGTVWFTDPVNPDALKQNQPWPAVFRFDPSTQEIRPVATNFTAPMNYPNGLCFSPDESKLYVADSWQRSILVFDVQADGTLANNRVFAKDIGIALPELPDGIRCDRSGRIFCTLANAGARSGVRIYDPSGELLGTILTPESVANLCFGGPNQEMIFFTASTSVYGITRMPDLIVTALNRIPANPTAGEPVTFSATVKNQGTGPTPNGAATLVAFSVDGATNVVWSDGFSTSIPPDASVILTANAGVAGSTWTATVGSHSIRGMVDSLGVLAESIETNNVLSATFTVGAPPLDNDGDGLDDTREVLAGTDATDSASVLKILAAERLIDAHLVLIWSSVPGKAYRIARKSNIDDPQWASSIDMIPATGAATSWTNSVPYSERQAFFRILLVP